MKAIRFLRSYFSALELALWGGLHGDDPSGLFCL